MYPAYRAIEEIMELDFVPFGQSRVFQNENGDYTFECDHGDDECYGNLIHVSSILFSLVINLIIINDFRRAFIICIGKTLMIIMIIMTSIPGLK